MSGPARFIVLEGLDGAGKSTVAACLARRLDAELMSTPPDDLARVRARLDSVFDASPLGRSLFYAATVALASDRVARAIARGRRVVVDRYWSSTVVYAALRGVTTELDGIERRLLPADLTVYLHARREVRLQRIAARGVCTDEDRRTLDEAGERRLDHAFRQREASPTTGRFVALDVSAVGADEAAAQIARLAGGGQ